MRLHPLALAASVLFATGAAEAQAPLQPSRALTPPPRGEAARQLPIILRAQEVRARPDLEAVAEGDVEFRRGAVSIRADRLSYEVPEDLANARGNVQIRTDSATYSGPELQLRVQRFEGFFIDPRFEFHSIGAGGSAARIDFVDSARSRAIDVRYTSCPRDGSGDPDWLLSANRVKLDFDANEGIAEGAVLRFLDVPILALPVLSFPLTDERKSGWLPPSINLDSRSGIDLSVPYYWNLAPNRDATIAPRVITKRGIGADAEFRYLEPRWSGQVQFGGLPDDRVAGRSRQQLRWEHDADLPAARLRVDLVRVSDDGWWKDFPDAGRSITPRLLPLRASAERQFALAGGEGLLYGRVQRWQVLQGSDALVAPPFQRSPQLGARVSLANGRWEFSAESEFNRFTLPAGDPGTGRSGGLRWHALASAAWAWREAGGWLVPKLSVNAAEYRPDEPLADGRTRAGRVVPTASLDAGLIFERRWEALGREYEQTLEPRLLYVNTPFRAQAGLPVYDSVAKDFNFASIYAEQSFSGVDRVADAHQLTAGLTTRLIEPGSGAEALRLGLVQRYRFRPQRITARADGTPDGDQPIEQRFSDVLLLGSTGVLRHWTLEGSVQYSPDIARSVRSILSARYSPGDFRTVSTTYRLARGLSEQLEVGWQWPLAAGRRSGGDRCAIDWYSVGRFNYSLKDSRITDSIVGVELDAGCWIGRVVAERLSTGRSEATTRLLLQLELVGLSRIGSNPLRVLKDNIPGYRLLRDDPRSASDSVAP